MIGTMTRTGALFCLAAGAVFLVGPSASISARQTRSAATPPFELELQILLDRAGFSPGEIDGVAGPNSRKANAKARIAAGPNNPVGVVWIDIDKPHYGIHGTPEPGLVGHSTSHGCVRLTNWDALKLAALVTKGTAVVFTE